MTMRLIIPTPHTISCLSMETMMTIEGVRD